MIIKIFSAPSWCQPCRQYMPIIDALQKTKKYEDIEITDYNIDEEEKKELVMKYNIKRIPTTLLLKDENDTEPYRILGAVSLSTLYNEIDNFLQKNGSN